MMILVAFMLQGCSGDQGESTDLSEVPNEETLAARVNDWTITREFLQNYIDQLPEQQQASVDTPEGRALVAAQLIDEELFRREAERLDMDETDPWVRNQIDEARRRILIQGYFRKFVSAEAEPPEQDIHDYYEAHKDRYTTLAVVRAQHVFSTSKEKLEDIKEQVVHGGQKFTTMAHKYSEDEMTRDDGGDLGYFNPGGYIRGVGFSQTFSDTVFQLEQGGIHGPIKWEKGYSLVRINEKRPARLKPYAEVREEISQLLSRDRAENARQKVVERILTEQNYDVKNYMMDLYMSMQRSPEELWTFAQNAEDPKDRIRSFQEIVEKFPNDDYAPQALFMIGFVQAEELSDFNSADRTFGEVMKRYPESEYAEMARWMVGNMGKGVPKFEDIPQKMKEDS
jgi:parvulin-like peptidyl-prolyl isomerase